MLLIAFQVWPTVFTVLISFTNYGDGHLLTKEETIAKIEADSFQEFPSSRRYELTYLSSNDVTDTNIYALLKEEQTAEYFLATKDSLKPVAKDLVDTDSSGKVTEFAGYKILQAKDIGGRKDIQTFSIHIEDRIIRPLGIKSAIEGRPTLQYDAQADVIKNLETGKVYAADDGFWRADDGETLAQGWYKQVGWENFARIIENPTIRNGFVSIFIWNVVFAFLSVVTTFLLGLLFALIFNSKQLHGKKIGRALLILPYAIPGFVTALVWRSMFNQEFGLINTLLNLNIDWLGDPTAAKFAVILTNLWLGFPYMFLVCTGALQSIPHDIQEAATLDGASKFKRAVYITMPLLLVAVGPLLVASFAFNFNNFGLIYLLTDGGPFTGNNTSVGATDLLITYAFRIAFGGSGNDYGLASAVSLVIFFIVAAMGAIGFGRTKAWEEMR
ncbi:ABC transporter permease subunit [Arcanobacterium hippocoleae]